jgi:hypothetical protein
MRSPNSLPPRSTSPASSSSTPPDSPALAGTADALHGPHAGAGPSNAPRVGQRRSAQRAGLNAPRARARAAPALRPGGLPPLARAAPLHHGPDALGFIGSQELDELLEGELSDPSSVPQSAGAPHLADSDGLPSLAALLNEAAHGHAYPHTGAHSTASSSLPLGPSSSDGLLPPLEELMSPTQQGRALRNRPASQELLNTLQAQIAAKKGTGQRSREGRALNRVHQSLQEALQAPQRRQALQAQGISLHSHGVDPQGQPVTRQRQFTPLLEQAERQALVHLEGLSDADMAPLDRAFFMANMLREQLGQEKAAGAPRTLAQAAGATSGEKEMSKAERRQLMGLVTTYTGRTLGLDPASTVRLQQRLGNSTNYNSQAFQQKLLDLSGRQGPLALALVHKLYDHEWVNNENVGPDGIKARNAVPGKHRTAFVEALTRVEPGSIHRLIDAAHDPDPSALARVCAGIETEMAADPTFGNRNPNQQSFLSNALLRLQGENPATAAYADAPPADQALRWLQSKAPSATLG